MSLHPFAYFYIFKLIHTVGISARHHALAGPAAPPPRLLSTLHTLPLPATTLAMLPLPLVLPEGSAVGGAGGAGRQQQVALLGAAVTARGTVELFTVRRGTVRVKSPKPEPAVFLPAD